MNSREDIRRKTFGRFEEDSYENEKTAVDYQDKGKSAETETAPPAPTEKKVEGKKQSLISRLKERVSKPPTEAVPESWTGQTSVLDILAPSSVDNGSRDYIVVDGVYHAYLYVAGYGYRTRNEAAWLSPLIEAGDNIGISFTFRKMPKDKILSRIAQKTMLNRSRMREVGDTRQDYEEIDNAIASGFYLKDGINRANQDFYYMTTVIEITAENVEDLESRVNEVLTLCASMSMVCKRADYKHEQCFLTSLPILSVDPDIERKGRRNGVIPLFILGDI